MPESETFSTHSFGQLRIFLRSGDRLKARSWRERWNNPPVYQRLLRSAHAYGLLHGTVRQCISGFTDPSTSIQHDHPEHGNGRLPIYVELLGSREQLEGFCREATDLLRGRVVVYKEIERWHWDSPERPSPEAAKIPAADLNQ